MGRAATSDETDHDLVLAFAGAAARQGWSSRTLRTFCEENHISPEERRRRWPRGVRSLGRSLNALADAETLAACDRNSPQPLSSVLLGRFEANEPLKAAVRSLAVSDMLHPLDTIRRTVKTASLFWRCQDPPPSRSSLVQAVKTGALVMFYSLAVIVWFCDSPPAYRRLRRMIRFTLLALGAR
jgi:hypothetical protein